MAVLKRIEDAKPGMVLAEAVYNAQGVLLVNEGTELSERNIEVLQSWKVSDVRVAGEDEEEEEKDIEPGSEMVASIENELREKFSEVLEDQVMMEIMRVACIQLQKRSLKKEG